MKILMFSLIVLLATTSIFAQEPLMKAYLQDGSYKTYRTKDIENMEIISGSSNSVMKVYYNKVESINFPSIAIDSIKIIKDITGKEVFSVVMYGDKREFALSTIDSIIFYVKNSEVFETVVIGEQEWMQYNLDVTHYRNGDEIPQVQDRTEWENLTTGAWCYYNNDEKNGETYGKLYNWYAVNDPRGLAPEGWRVPSDDDWTTLTNYLGSNAGAKLAGGYDLWYNGNLRNHSDFNSSCFSGLPGGYRYYSGYFTLSYRAFWWSSTEYSSTNAILRTLSYTSTYVTRATNGKRSGFSVRCVRD